MPTLEPHGKGYVVIDGTIEMNGMKEVAPGVCPKCETQAPPWEPPTDRLPAKRIAALKEIHGDDAHKVWLKQQGGFIAVCTNCQTSFWVPSFAVRIE